MYKLSLIDKISLFLIFIGGLSWGLIGLFDFNIANFILSKIPLLEKIFYILIGVATINTVLFIKKSTN